MLVLVVAARLVFGAAVLARDVDALVLWVDIDHAGIVFVIVARESRRRTGGERNSNGDGSAFHGLVLGRCVVGDCSVDAAVEDDGHTIVIALVGRVAIVVIVGRTPYRSVPVLVHDYRWPRVR